MHILLPNAQLIDAFSITPVLIQTMICVQKFVKEGIVTSQVHFWSFDKPAFGKKAFDKKVFGKKKYFIGMC